MHRGSLVPQEGDVLPWEMHQREKPCPPRVDLLLLVQEALRTLGGQGWPFLRPEHPPVAGSAGPGDKSLPSPRSSPIPLPPSCPDSDLWVPGHDQGTQSGLITQWLQEKVL